MAERILVTGGAGFVGLHLTRHLLREGAEVVLLDDFSRGRQDEELRGLRGSVELVEHDLTRPIPDGLLTGAFDGVYHLAAVVGVRRANEEPARVLNVNLRATLQVLDWCLRTGPGAVFLSSTSEVGDGAARVGLSAYPTKEDSPFVLVDPAAPRSSYALSKVVGESLFRQCADEFKVRIGRYHNIYGPRMGNSHVIPQFIARARAHQDPFPIYGAVQTRAFCYIDDAVEATVGLMKLNTAGPVVANIGNDREELKIELLARRIWELAGYDPVALIHDPPPGSPDRRLPDLARLRETTGFTPRVDLETGLRRTYEWYDGQP
ncbi:NAD-dependent epimerase/dehydratase family protein [Amycolatopsis sp. H20-H5]|uniref:NAD-dependent epimerase/dehydratase family protein n=1 Tax=Amycolatopsis sp. H20-H5 TaxID=3046309 RepID=UPI002DBC4CE6|nr:NAD-dependent epimerase/dehydratase family protein [Amycolatopsis sp. H20-H5]MEC3976887.1 NAD-dependent epimerase/dehydratase family protein [Amycolatopsis sp. H20-H5]